MHRDVKPGNLIVKPSGAVILVDFGVARSTTVTSVTQVNAIVGTALYMAPEQVAKGKVTAATDIYALGAVAYHCISGEPPFDGDNALQVALRHLEDEPEPLAAHVPPEVRDLIARAMAKQPVDRFPTAADFAEAAFAAAGPLDWKRLTGTALVAPLSPPAPTRTVPVPRDLPLSPPSPAKRQPRSETALLAAVCAIGVLALVLLGMLFLNDGDSPQKVKEGINVPPTAASDGPSLGPALIPSAPASKAGVKQNGSNRSNNASASASASGTSTPSTSTTPTDPTTPPTTDPTTPPTTDPTTPPTTEPTTVPPAPGP